MRKMTWRWGTRRVDYRRVKESLCSLEGGHTYFKGVVTWMHRNLGRAACGQDEPFSEDIPGLGLMAQTQHDLPGPGRGW